LQDRFILDVFEYAGFYCFTSSAKEAWVRGRDNENALYLEHTLPNAPFFGTRYIARRVSIDCFNERNQTHVLFSFFNCGG